MAFCSLCRQIPGEFFSQEPTENGKTTEICFVDFAQDTVEYLHHHIRDLEHSATLGCPLCKLLHSTVATSSLCRGSAADHKLIFKRFRPHCAFTYHRDATKFGLYAMTEFMPAYSYVHYSRIPSSWGRYKDCYKQMAAKWL